MHIVKSYRRSAKVAFFAGDIDTAIALTQKTWEVAGASAVGNDARCAERSSNIAAYSLCRNDVDGGLEIAREALDYGLLSGDPILTACIIQHFAYASALRGNARRAARLLGFVRARAGDTNDIALCLENYLADRIVELLKALVPEDERTALMRDGSLWSEDRAVEEALLVQ